MKESPFGRLTFISRASGVEGVSLRKSTHEAGKSISYGGPAAIACSSAMLKSYSIMRTTMLASGVLWHSMW